jgi:iron complex outermembrane receptor protein
MVTNGQVECRLTLRGKVVHQENNEPIEGAVVWLIEHKKSAVTDSKGNFRIDDLCPKTDQIKIQYIGHREYTEAVDVGGGKNFTFRLQAEDINLEGVDIHGHQDALLTSNTLSSLRGGQLKASRGESLGETLRQIPGVTSFSTGFTIQKPVIHGLHSNRILILNNGVRLEGQQWGAEHAPEIDPFLAQEITVVKGAESVRFGPDAMGGVILVNPAALPVKAGHSGALDLVGASNGRGLAAAGYLSGGSKKIHGLGYRIQGSSRIAGNLHTPEYMLDNTGMRELGFSGAVGYSNDRLGTEAYFSHFQTKIGILADAHTGNLSDLESIVKNGRPFREAEFSYGIRNPQQNVNHQILKLKGHYHLSPSSKINFQYAFQRNNRQEFDRRRGERNERPALDLVLFTNTFDIFLNHQTRKNWNGSLGIQLIQQANSNVPGTGVVPLIPNYDMANLGAFAIQKYTKGPLEIEGGLRYDLRWLQTARIVRGELEESDLRFENFSAFIGGFYALSPSITFNSNLATAWRAPNVNELFSQGLHHGLAAVEIGNPNLKSEKSLKWINTLQYAQNNLQIEFTGYAQHIRDYIYLNPKDEPFVSLRGTFNVFEYLQADANFWGTDLNAVWTLHPKWEVYSRGSIVRAKNLNDGSFFPFIPADRVETGLSFLLPKNDKRRESRITISNLSVAEQIRVPEFDFAPAPPAYSIWNFSAQSGFELGKNSLTVGLQVNNVFDASFRDYMNRFRYFSHEIGTNVLIKVNYEF